MRKRICTVFLIVFLLIAGFGRAPDKAYAQTNEPTKIINVVYDDSGSMIVDGSGNKCDTWCQAKYAMEVFAAMLGDNNTMNIYVMSDFQDTAAAGPMMTLKGASDDKVNVGKIHDMLTPYAKYTTFATVEKAYEDLRTANADEKWLVVLTDGEFNKPVMKSGDLEQYFARKDPDVNIMFLGMGPGAASIQPDEANNIFFEKAETSSDILYKITKICNRVFNSNMMEIDPQTGLLEFDVPMEELVVFAQGDGVKLKSVKKQGGSSIPGLAGEVDVKYSERACSNDTGRYADPLIGRDLVGTLAAYKGLYDAGAYVVDTDNAKTVEVYYKPSVEIMAYLIDEEGREIRSDETVEPGDYTLRFNFVKTGTTEKVEESSLLGNVTYSAHVIGSGLDADKFYKSGDKISLSEGHYKIDASADLPQFYRTVTTQMNMDVFWHRELGVSSNTDNPTYYINKNKKEEVDGFVNADEPTVITLNLDGSGLSEEEWQKIPVPEVEQVANKDFRVDFRAEKTDQAGVIHIYPFLKSGKTDVLNEYHDIDVKVSFAVDMTGQAWNGEAVQTIPIVDNRPWYWKHMDKVWKLGVLGAIAFLGAGYLPAFKKYLPKQLKSQPTVECRPNRPGQKTYSGKGRYQKDRLSTILPYKAETGTIRFMPRGVPGSPVALQVKAVESKRRMEVTNTSVYENMKGLTINGNAVVKNKKNITLTPSASIIYRTADTTYSCTLNK